MILANMLPDRPQQTFFEHLVQWPRLRRRIVADLRRLVASAGWPLERLRIVAPAREDVDPGRAAPALRPRIGFDDFVNSALPPGGRVR